LQALKQKQADGKMAARKWDHAAHVLGSSLGRKRPRVQR